MRLEYYATTRDYEDLDAKERVSNKFWEPELEGGCLTVRFGKIGTKGQTHSKAFSSPEAALVEYRRAVCEKLAKGYKPTKETFFELLGKASPQSPAAIASSYIGEHVPDTMIQDMCAWMTACLQFGMSPKQFKSVWNRFLDGGDDELESALGQVHAKFTDYSSGSDEETSEQDKKIDRMLKERESEYWQDMTEELFELGDLYAVAVEKGGDRFIWFNNNAYIDIVAVRGNPGARAIEVCVLKEENCKDERGEWSIVWPPELDVGSPILFIQNECAVLLDGREYEAPHRS